MIFEILFKAYMYIIMSCIICIVLIINILFVIQLTLKFRTWSRPNAIDTTDYALDTGIKMLTYFEEYFDYAYPMEKLGSVLYLTFAIILYIMTKRPNGSKTHLPTNKQTKHNPNEKTNKTWQGKLYFISLLVLWTVLMKPFK